MKCRGAKACQCGCYLAGDMPRLAHTSDNDFSLAVHYELDQIGEILAQRVAGLGECLYLNVKDMARFAQYVKMCHCIVFS